MTLAFNSSIVSNSPRIFNPAPSTPCLPLNAFVIVIVLLNTFPSIVTTISNVALFDVSFAILNVLKLVLLASQSLQLYPIVAEPVLSIAP